jgi:hypothetical protein
MLPVEANLEDKPLEFALTCPLLISGYQLYYCLRNQYTGCMIMRHLLLRVAFSSSLRLKCAAQWCDRIVRACACACAYACAPTCVPSNKCGRFHEPEPKQRDLPQPFDGVGRHIRYST